MGRAISVSNLTIGYRNRHQTTEIAKITDLPLTQGKLTCLLGANGIGKSTLIKTITGALPALEGEILVNNLNLRHLGIKERAKQIATVLTDKPNLGYTTVYEMVALGRHPHTNWQNRLTDEDEKVINSCLNAIGMANAAYQPLAELSDGNLQKVIIGRALAQESDIIILDEPTVHLDVTNKTSIINLLRSLCTKHGKTVLLSTHDLDLAFKYSDYLWLFDTHTVHHGLVEDLILQGAVEGVFPTVIAESGKPNLKINISGSDRLVALTRNALLKAGIYDHLIIKEVQIIEAPDKLWYKTAENSFETLEALIKSLS